MFDDLESLLKSGDLQGAEALVNKAIKPSCSAADLVKVVDLFFNYSFIDSGFLYYKKVLDIDSIVIDKYLLSWLELEAIIDNVSMIEKLILPLLELYPDYQELKLILALKYLNAQQFETAERYYLKALDDKGDIIRPLLGLLEVYIRLNRYHDAIACGKLVLEQDPDNRNGLFNTAFCHLQLNQFVEAYSYFEKLLELFPEDASVHNTLALLMLKLGNFEAGWRHNEWRWTDTDNLATVKAPFPRWQGEALKDRKIFVWADQGVGDTIMYAGMLRKLIQLGARLEIVADPRLKNLMERSFPVEKYLGHTKTGQYEISGDISYQSSFGSLPTYLIKKFEDFGSGDPYFKLDDEALKNYSGELTKRFPGKKLIGFSWRGGDIRTKSYSRSFPVNLFSGLIRSEDYQFINLQYDATDEEISQLSELGCYTPDFDCKNDLDVLALCLKSLDAFVSADNSTVHLAGAVGANVLLLLPFSAEWRWFLEVDKSYWYSSVRLIRQQEVGVWEACIDKVGNYLADL